MVLTMTMILIVCGAECSNPGQRLVAGSEGFSEKHEGVSCFLVDRGCKGWLALRGVYARNVEVWSHTW